MNTRDRRGTRFEHGKATPVTDALTVEEALQVNINRAPFSITMRTPGEDRDLVRGLLFTERVMTDPQAEFEYSVMERAASGHNAVVNVELPDMGAASSKRSLIASASCGLCGKRDLSDIEMALDPLTPEVPLDMDLLPAMAEAMRARQETFHRSGGSHAAAAFTCGGELLAHHEDIGRHNAVDKVVGALLEQGNLGRAGCLFVSGRLSFEIIYKAYTAKLAYIMAVSAPSSLAVEIAEAQGMTVVGFCREGRATVYTNPQHLRGARPGG